MKAPFCTLPLKTKVTEVAFQFHLAPFHADDVLVAWILANQQAVIVKAVFFILLFSLVSRHDRHFLPKVVKFFSA